MSTTFRPIDLSSTPTAGDDHERITIALVNNMPDAALQTTERQFRDLLQVAGASWDVRLRLFSFPELIRSDAGKTYVAEQYEGIDQLWAGDFDGLIVTGAEPRTASLSDEVYWPSLTRLVDWCNDADMPTVWSCLAAHAAVLHLDGIQRRRLGEKVAGVFRCMKVRDDRVLAGLPGSWRIPHSRLNTLEPDPLAAAGYEMLSFSEEAGADTFALRRGAPFVFCQGHPEYDPGALYREYRRDVGRFLSGSAERYPEMPRGYFDGDAARAFMVFRARALRHRSRDLLEQFPRGEARERPPHLWREVAIQLYTNWLAQIVRRRDTAAADASEEVFPARLP
jgi:homoserine O-succinyltransferase/O-acetyltransferase